MSYNLTKGAPRQMLDVSCCGMCSSKARWEFSLPELDPSMYRCLASAACAGCLPCQSLSFGLQFLAF